MRVAAYLLGLGLLLGALVGACFYTRPGKLVVGTRYWFWRATRAESESERRLYLRRALDAPYGLDGTVPRVLDVPDRQASLLLWRGLLGVAPQSRSALLRIAIVHLARPLQPQQGRSDEDIADYLLAALDSSQVATDEVREAVQIVQEPSKRQRLFALLAKNAENEASRDASRRLESTDNSSHTLNRRKTQ